MYTLSFSLDLGASGLNLRASLVSSGAVHATLRNISTGFHSDGHGGYEFITSLVPDGFRGVVLFHTGDIPASPSNDLAGIEIQSRASVNPQEAEFTDSKVSTVSAEVEKIPRKGETFKHTNIATGRVGTVLIEEP